VIVRKHIPSVELKSTSKKCGLNKWVGMKLPRLCLRRCDAHDLKQDVCPRL
jgi:hypothetical protein